MDETDITTLEDENGPSPVYTDPGDGRVYYYDENGQIASTDPNNPLDDPSYTGPAPDVVNPDFYAEAGTGNIYWLDDNGTRHYTGDVYPNATDGTLALGKAPASNIVSQANQAAAAAASNPTGSGSPTGGSGSGLSLGTAPKAPTPTSSTVPPGGTPAQSTTKGIASLALAAFAIFALFKMTKRT